ncbi:MAG: hypothetical protein EBU40_16720 [Proteobacteria bacterium]|nr:hypothetical protein [Pseudomonadota bacterium]
MGNLNAHIGAKATGETDALASLGLGVVVIMTMALILASRSRTWGTLVWWSGVAFTALAVPMLALGEPSLALGALVGGPSSRASPKIWDDDGRSNLKFAVRLPPRLDTRRDGARPSR